ncbi:serine/arginine repetitive matrix protein 3-like [Panicum virgatum]|uniref:serine/arginine repetitive matrix protein 3-like n=1 Tax=Panicum virgatum TaxID=38727 RepID=UPI0019D62AA6|nr:serine/arginine repetitive matrix protein 3-like [Panicum virgatum]
MRTLFFLPEPKPSLVTGVIRGAALRVGSTTARSSSAGRTGRFAARSSSFFAPHHEGSRGARAMGNSRGGREGAEGRRRLAISEPRAAVLRTSSAPRPRRQSSQRRRRRGGVRARPAELRAPLRVARRRRRRPCTPPRAGPRSFTSSPPRGCWALLRAWPACSPWPEHPPCPARREAGVPSSRSPPQGRDEGRQRGRGREAWRERGGRRMAVQDPTTGRWPPRAVPPAASEGASPEE